MPHESCPLNCTIPLAESQLKPLTCPNDALIFLWRGVSLLSKVVLWGVSYPRVLQISSSSSLRQGERIHHESKVANPTQVEKYIEEVLSVSSRGKKEN